MGDPFRALADPTRRLILDELAERDGQTLFEICARLANRHGVASSRQAISQHLDVLEAAHAQPRATRDHAGPLAAPAATHPNQRGGRSCESTW